MTDEVEIVIDMFCLAEILVESGHGTGDPAIAAFDQGTGGKISLQISQESISFVFFLRTQKSPKKKLEFVCFQFLCRISKKLSGDIASLCQILQLPAEPGLGGTRQIGVGNDLGIELMGFVDRCFFSQGHK